MFLVGLLQWWYGHGWLSQAVLFRTHLAGTAAFFSIGELAATLFAPFRQISAGQVRGSISAQLHAVADKLLSRLIGAFVRLVMIVAGILTLAVRTVIEGVVLIGWLLVPTVPIAGFIVFAIGWVPTWM